MNCLERFSKNEKSEWERRERQEVEAKAEKVEALSQ